MKIEQRTLLSPFCFTLFKQIKSAYLWLLTIRNNSTTGGGLMDKMHFNFGVITKSRLQDRRHVVTEVSPISKLFRKCSNSVEREINGLARRPCLMFSPDNR